MNIRYANYFVIERWHNGTLHQETTIVFCKCRRFLRKDDLGRSNWFSERIHRQRVAVVKWSLTETVKALFEE